MKFQIGRSILLDQLKIINYQQQQTVQYVRGKNVNTMSRTLSKSFNRVEPENESLKQHIQKLMELSNEIVNYKLQRQQQKQKRVQAVQQQFVEWADKKQSQIREKLEKSSKLKEEYINKIVKKCKDNQKYLGEKLKNFQDKKKESLRQAWKMTAKYKNDFQGNQRSMTRSQSNNNNKNLAQSQLLYRKKISLDRKKQFQASSYETEKFAKRQITNQTKSRGQFRIKQKQTSQPIHYLTEADEHYQQKQMKHFEEKLQQAFSRFKHNLAEQQQAKIQQLGQRLQKIEKGRNRKVEMIKKKKQKYTRFHDNQREERRQKKVKKSQRVHSESVMRQKRVHDWSLANKSKRQEFFLSQIQNGNNYLQNSKLKFLKTTIAKKIALSTIEKKLYLQRLKH